MLNNNRRSGRPNKQTWQWTIAYVENAFGRLIGHRESTRYRRIVSVELRRNSIT